MKATPSHSGPPLVIAITGYRGLAETFLETFAGAGHQVSCLVRRKEKLPELRGKYPGVFFFAGDVGSQESCDAWVGQTLELFGRIDGIVNNAAIAGPGGKLHEIAFDAFEETVRLNLLAPAYLCHLVLPHLLASKRGVVLNLSGGGATFPRPAFAAYGASKCALVRLTETLALEYPEVGCYAMAPGALRTPMMASLAQMDPSKIGGEHEAAKRCLEAGGDDPARAAALALWLFEHRPKALSGKLISAKWDDYRNAPAYPDELGWWTLRRVDEECVKKLKSLS